MKSKTLKNKLLQLIQLHDTLLSIIHRAVENLKGHNANLELDDVARLISVHASAFRI
jgi:hypothetical protein